MDDPTRSPPGAEPSNAGAQLAPIPYGAPPRTPVPYVTAPHHPLPPATMPAQLPEGGRAHTGLLHCHPLAGMPSASTQGGGAGVNVHISNVVAPQPYVVLAPYPPPPLAPAAITYPPTAVHPLGRPNLKPSPMSKADALVPRGLLGMMRDDASQRAMEALARRGPARVLAYGVAAGATLAVVAVALLIPFWGAGFPVFLALVPLAVLAALALFVGARAGHGVRSHHLEQAILRVACENGGAVGVVTLARATGRPLRECQIALDAMASSGHASVESDEFGALVYRVPDLEPRRTRLATPCS